MLPVCFFCCGFVRGACGRARWALRDETRCRATRCGGAVCGGAWRGAEGKLGARSVSGRRGAAGGREDHRVVIESRVRSRRQPVVTAFPAHAKQRAPGARAAPGRGRLTISIGIALFSIRRRRRRRRRAGRAACSVGRERRFRGRPAVAAASSQRRRSSAGSASTSRRAARCLRRRARRRATPPSPTRHGSAAQAPRGRELLATAAARGLPRALLRQGGIRCGAAPSARRTPSRPASPTAHRRVSLQNFVCFEKPEGSSRTRCT